jgi:ubiquinone/menaquinone biosynthesis C-methylase UbiE
MINYFDSQSAAERYASGRPFFHPQVIQRIKTHLRLKSSVEHAIDVGCGTGLSTIALLDIANKITGTDISAEMLAVAPPNPRITYLVAPAEELPFPAGSTDLITVSSALHWINSEKFLGEAHRILRRKSWLIVYDNAFTGILKENPEFQRWIGEVFLKRYPTPPRTESSFTVKVAQQAGFSYPKEEHYQNSVNFTPEQLINYLLSQSNVIAAQKNGKERLEAIQSWLQGEITPLFKHQPGGTFLFRGTIWYLKRT